MAYRKEHRAALSAPLFRLAGSGGAAKQHLPKSQSLRIRPRQEGLLQRSLACLFVHSEVPGGFSYYSARRLQLL